VCSYYRQREKERERQTHTDREIAITDMYEYIDADAQGDTIRDGEDFIEVLDAFLGFDLREDHDAPTRKPQHLHAINKSSQIRSSCSHRDAPPSLYPTTPALDPLLA
jgi:hypothetical protein